MGLFSAFSGDDARAAAATKAAGYAKGYSDLSSLYGQGRDALTTNFSDASKYYDPLYSTASKGYSLYGDALGINGPTGNANATAAFQQGPGYQVQLKAGLDAIDRGAASRGLLSSGNTVAAEQKYGNDLANLGYSNWLTALGGTGNTALSAAGGGAAIKTGLGTALNTNFTGQGGASYAADTGAADATAQGQLADQQASLNSWNAIFNAANLGASVYGYSQGAKKV